MEEIFRTDLDPAGMPHGNSEGVVTATTVTTNYLVHKVPANQVTGFSRTAKITKLHFRNKSTTSVWILIGSTSDGTTAGVFTANMVGFWAIAGTEGNVTEDMIIKRTYDSGGNILCQISATAAGGGAGVDIECQVEEKD